MPQKDSIVVPTLIGGVASLAFITFLTSVPNARQTKTMKQKIEDTPVPDEWIEVHISTGEKMKLHKFKKYIKDPDNFEEEYRYLKEFPQKGRHWKQKQAALYQRKVKMEAKQGIYTTYERQQRAAEHYGRG